MMSCTPTLPRAPRPVGAGMLARTPSRVPRDTASQARASPRAPRSVGSGLDPRAHPTARAARRRE